MCDPSTEDEPLPASIASAPIAEVSNQLAQFLGCDMEEATETAMAQYEQCVVLWPTLQKEVGDKPISAGEFWRSLSTTLPDLAPLALWWVEFPTSSVAAERAFGMMRAIDMPNRSRMKDETFLAEFMFRVNGELVAQLLAEKQAIADMAGPELWGK